MRNAKIAFIALWVVLVSVAPVAKSDDVKPIAPSNPVEVSVEVGSVAGKFTAKVVVVLKAVVNKKGTTFTTVLEKHANLDYTELKLDVDGTKALISALGEATTNADSDYTKDLVTLHIESREDDGKRYVSIRQKEDRISFRDGRVEMDMDNALALQLQLKKLQGIQSWLSDKVTVFEKK